MRGIKPILTLGIALLTLAVASGSSFAAIQVTTDGPEEAVIGQTFSLTVNSAGTDLIGAVVVRMTFDKTKAQMTDVKSDLSGALLSTADEANAAGVVKLDFMDMTFAGVKAGVLMTVTFKAIGVENDKAEFAYNADESVIAGLDGAAIAGTTFTGTSVTFKDNNTPIAKDGELTTEEDKAASGKLDGTDPDGDAITFDLSATVKAQKGEVKILDAKTGDYTYTPAKDANGDDTFGFVVTDAKGAKGEAAVKVTITAVNDAPVADAGTLEVTEDVTASGTLVATDPEGDKLTYSIATPPTKGVVTIKDVAAGTYEYVPNKDENGTDKFTFAADDGKLKATAEITVTIAAVNDPPVAEAGKATWVLSDPTTFKGTLVAKDVDNDVLAYKIVTQPTQGTVTVDATGAYTFAPKDAKPGLDTFTFVVNDGKVDSEPATIEVTIESGAHKLTVTTVLPAGGKVTPTGEVVVEDGKDQLFKLTVNDGYYVSSPVRVTWADGTKTTCKVEDNKFTVPAVKQDGTVKVVFKAQYTITLSATPEKGGVCDPMGPAILVNGGADQTITVTANKGFMIEEVKIDGVAATIADDTSKTFTHTFTAVAANHTVDVVFESTGEYHSGDMDMDNVVSMPELLRVIQLFNLNMGQYVCDGTTEDGYASGNDAAKRTCMQHSADSDDDWTFSLSELLRVIQFWSLGGYHKATPADEGFPTKDGFAPGK